MNKKVDNSTNINEDSINRNYMQKIAYFTKVNCMLQDRINIQLIIEFCNFLRLKGAK
jgi:hypothetical protein